MLFQIIFYLIKTMLAQIQQENQYMVKTKECQFDKLTIIVEPTFKSAEYIYYETIVTKKIFQNSGLSRIFELEPFKCYLEKRDHFKVKQKDLVLQILLPNIGSKSIDPIQLILESKTRRFQSDLEKTIQKCKSQENLTQKQAKQFFLNISQYLVRRLQDEDRQQKYQNKQIKQLRSYIEKARHQYSIIKQQLSQRRQIKQEIKQVPKYINLQDFQQFFVKFHSQQKQKLNQHQRKVNQILRKMENKLEDFLQRTQKEINKLRTGLVKIQKKLNLLSTSGKKISKLFEPQKVEGGKKNLNKMNTQKRLQQQGQSIMIEENKNNIEDSDEESCQIEKIITTKYKKTIINEKQVRMDFYDGSYYIGQIKDQIFHGQGFYFGSDGCSYEGFYIAGKQHGFGVKIDNVGNKSTGIYINGLRSGKGIDMYANGEIYEGEFDQQKKQGYGVYTFNDGSSYEGMWKMNKYHGMGVQINIDGSRYEGFWQEDEKHGKGILYRGDKQTQQQWQKGKLKSQRQIQRS